MTEPASAHAFAAPEDARRSTRLRSETLTIAMTFVLSGLLVVVSGFISPALGSWSQVDTILTLASFLIVIAFGQGLVILVGGLDLSIGSVIMLGGVMVTAWSGTGYPQFLMILAAMALAAGVGLINALGVLWLKVPPFIMTMATGIIVASAALGYTKGTPRGVTPDLFTLLMKSSLLGMPVILIFVGLFVVAGAILQGWTSFGRRLQAIGININAARVAGLSVTRPVVAAYMMSSACAGFTGMMLVGYANGATLRMGDSYLLPSIAAVVIGGSSILGGRGSFIGTVGGAVLLTTLGTVISALGIEQGWRTVIEGCIIVTALLMLNESFMMFLKGSAKR
jgi:ribose transport system permease protein